MIEMNLLSLFLQSTQSKLLNVLLFIGNDSTLAYLLICIIVVLLFVIWQMSRTIIRLTDNAMDKYEMENRFAKPNKS